MKIRKAVITAAGAQHASLPLQTLVDRAGEVRTALRLTLDEVVAAGIEEIALVIRPGQRESYSTAAGSHASRLVFFEQTKPRGYGDAILRATDFLGGESFLHLVSDHLYLSRGDRLCAEQLVDAAVRHGCSVSAIQPTRENEIVHFGTVGGTPVPNEARLYEVSTVVEKPTPTIAEQRLIVAGQRAGHYLCLFGMHVLTPTVITILREALNAAPAGGVIDLSSSLNRLASTERYLALAVQGSRYNISEKYGLLIAQLAFGLSGVDRERILAELVQLLASGQTPSAGGGRQS
jgi:UTP--glucose-1-phosphate uridylyltransferase